MRGCNVVDLYAEDHNAVLQGAATLWGASGGVNVLPALTFNFLGGRTISAKNDNVNAVNDL